MWDRKLLTMRRTLLVFCGQPVRVQPSGRTCVFSQWLSREPKVLIQEQQIIPNLEHHPLMVFRGCNVSCFLGFFLLTLQHRLFPVNSQTSRLTSETGITWESWKSTGTSDILLSSLRLQYVKGASINPSVWPDKGKGGQPYLRYVLCSP